MGHRKCKKKWCPSCAPALAMKKNLRIQAAVERFRWPLFVTLTMKNVDDLSFGAVRDLRRAFGKMRHRKWWKKAVKGGVACIEVTNKGKGWHPHLHAVVDSRFLSVTVKEPNPCWARKCKKEAFDAAAKELGEAWAKLLGQELASIYIKRANSKTILKEVVKYAVKGSDLVACQGKLGNLVRAIEGTRLLTTFGTVYRLGKTPPSAQMDAEQIQSKASLSQGENRDSCCEHAQLIPLEVWQRRLSRPSYNHG